jgi:hypothetical protein
MTTTRTLTFAFVLLTCAAAAQQATTNRVRSAITREDFGEEVEQIRITGTPFLGVGLHPSNHSILADDRLQPGERIGNCLT